jgi:hypothetical protein
MDGNHHTGNDEKENALGDFEGELGKHKSHKRGYKNNQGDTADTDNQTVDEVFQKCRGKNQLVVAEKEFFRRLPDIHHILRKALETVEYQKQQREAGKNEDHNAKEIDAGLKQFIAYRFFFHINEPPSPW